MIIDLFKFTQGDAVWRYTSHDQDFIYADDVSIDGSNTLSHVYEAVPISRTAPEVTNDIERNSVDFSFPLINEMVQAQLEGFIEQALQVSIVRYNTDSGITTILWDGILSQIAPDMNEAKLSFDSAYTSLKRIGLRYKYQRICPHVLFQGRCRLNEDDFKEHVNIIAIDSTSIHVGALAHSLDYYIGGQIIFGEYRRFIIGEDGTNLIMFRTFDALTEAFAAGQVGAIDIVPGCDRAIATCNNKYNNIDNFGGFPYIPESNPYNAQI